MCARACVCVCVLRTAIILTVITNFFCDYIFNCKFYTITLITITLSIDSCIWFFKSLNQTFLLSPKVKVSFVVKTSLWWDSNPRLLFLFFLVLLVCFVSSKNAKSNHWRERTPFIAIFGAISIGPKYFFKKLRTWCIFFFFKISKIFLIYFFKYTSL